MESNFEKWYKWTYKTETDLQISKQAFGYQRGNVGEAVTILHIKSNVIMNSGQSTNPEVGTVTASQQQRSLIDKWK